jgi:hypothetical protein
MLSASFAKCHTCWMSQISFYADYHYAECRYAKFHYTECSYAECRYGKCRGAKLMCLSLASISILVSCSQKYSTQVGRPYSQTLAYVVKHARVKHGSLFSGSVSNKEEKFATSKLCYNGITIFMAVIYESDK